MRSANLPAPEVIAADIVEDLQAALAQFTAVTDARRDPNSGSELTIDTVEEVRDITCAAHS